MLLLYCMKLVHRFINRLESDGLLLSINLTLGYLFGVNILNFYNCLRFREHKIATSCEISTILPRSVQLPHPIGIVIGHEVEIGENVRIQQHVTLGRPIPEKSAGYPTIKKNVLIGTGATVIGDITIGENATIGANSVVLDDVAAGSAVAGVPATEI